MAEMLQVRPAPQASGNLALDGDAGSATTPSVSESRGDKSKPPSPANGTHSTQLHPTTTTTDTLVLPKFKKNTRKFDPHVHEVCCDKAPPGQMDGTLGSLKKNDVGLQGFAAVNVGTRDHMEDRHRIHYGRRDGLFQAFFGVFDGHGGEEASHFTMGHLSGYVEEQVNAVYREKAGLPPVAETVRGGASGAVAPEQKDNAPSLSKDELAALGLNYKLALTRAFDRLEENVLRQSRTIGCRDGTTVTTVLVTHDALICSNTGDSRTVLCRDNNAVALSTDHKPSGDGERSRIVAAGGEVRAVMLDRAAFCCFKAKKVPHGAERLWPGGFSVSRAVGDIDYKDLRRKKAAVVNVLIHTPEITVTSRNSRDQFVICGSDGLWDVLTNQQAVDFVLKEVRKRKVGEAVSDISQKLADHAYSLGSEDNISALIMWFTDASHPFK